MSKEEMEKKAIKWWGTLREMKKDGVISSDQHDELTTKVKEWLND